MMMPRAFASPLHSPSPRHVLPPPRHRRTLSSTLVDESVAAAAALVQKWHPADDDSPATATTRGSLFLRHDSADDEEAQRFLRAAADLHRVMLFFASDVANSTNNSHSGGGGHGLVQAQALLQSAMRRLDLELKLLLDHHDDDNDAGTGTTTTTLQLQAVAQAMMAAGYGKECVSTFRSHRRTALATKLQRLLGFSLSPPPAVGKLAWEQVDSNIIPSWIAAAPVAFNSLFVAEKDLCDAVFISSSDAAAAVIRDAVFAAIANDQATGLLAIAEAVVARAKRAPERLFRVLDVHDALTQALPALLSVFNNNYSEAESSEVATRAAAVVTKVAHAARATLSSFEAAIHKEPASKAATSARGAVHPLTRYVMNYLVFLADYQEGLALIYDVDEDQAAEGADDDDIAASPASSPSSSSSFPNPTSRPPIHRLVSTLMGKLEAKAGCYREVALSYLFLANNTHYVGNKVAGRRNLQAILGDAWAEAQMAKARAHVDVYVRAAWGNVMSAISMPPQPHGQYGSVEEAVMEAVGLQEQWAAADEEMAEALRLAATAAVVPKYRMFYRRHGAAVRLTPGDVTTMIAALFGGPLAAGEGQRSRPQRCKEVMANHHPTQEDHPNPRRPHHLST